MSKVWQEIEAWLESNSSEILNDLFPGTTEEEISKLEEHLQVKLPEEFKQLYLIHDGQKGFANPLMGEWELFSLKYIKSEWDVMKKLYEEGSFIDAVSKPTDTVKPDWWNIKWIPIAGNGGGDLICIDLDPNVGGKIGQIISFWHIEEKREKLADNFQIWLQEFANDLANGKYKARKNGKLIKVN